MKPPTTPLRIFTLLVFALSTYSQSSQDIRYNYEYSCNKERIVVGHCRHDSDMAGYPRTKPEDDYCQVYYPDRPKMGGFEAFATVLRADVIKTLQACGAFRPAPVPPSQSEIEDSVAEFKVGDAYFKGNDYQRALEHFKKSNAIGPSSAAYIMTGITQYKLKMYPEAIDSLKETIQMVPDNPESHYWLGMAYRDYGATTKNEKQYPIAENELREAIRLKPEYQIAYTWLGSVLYVERKYSDALTTFQQALRLNQNDGSAKYLMGFTYVRMGQKEKAMEVYRSLTAVDPKSAADLLAEINKPSPAAETVGTGPGTMSPKPGSAEAYGYQAKDFNDAGQYAKAIDAAKKAIQLNPRIDWIHENLGFAYYKLGQYQAALPEFKEAARLDPKDDGYHFWVGVTQRELDQGALAESSLLESIRLNATSEDAHYQLGQVYLYNLKLNDKAAGQFREAIRLNPKYAVAHNQLGLVFLNLKQYQNALAEFKEAFRLGPDSLALQNVGVAYIRLGQKEDARKVYEQLKTMDPKKASELLPSIESPPVSGSKGTKSAGSTVSQATIDKITAQVIAYRLKHEKAVNNVTALYDAKQYDKALAACTQMLKSDPQDGDAFYYQAMIYFRLQKWQLSLDAWDKYFPNITREVHAEDFLLYGDARRHLKQYDNAIKAYEFALKYNPDTETMAALDLHKGMTYYEIGKYDDAAEELTEAVRLAPYDAETHYDLGMAYVAIGKEEEAWKEYYVLLKLDKPLAGKLATAALNKFPGRPPN